MKYIASLPYSLFKDMLGAVSDVHSYTPKAIKTKKFDPNYVCETCVKLTKNKRKHVLCKDSFCMCRRCGNILNAK